MSEAQDTKHRHYNEYYDETIIQDIHLFMDTNPITFNGQNTCPTSRLNIFLLFDFLEL